MMTIRARVLKLTACILLIAAPLAGAKELLPPQPKPMHDEKISRDREHAPTRAPANGSVERPNNRGAEIKSSSAKPRSKAYADAIAASKKGSHSPEGVWNQEYLNSSKPEAKRLKEVIERYEGGQIGASVRKLDVNQKTAAEIDFEAIKSGFSKKTEPLYPTSRKDYDQLTSSEKETQQIFYTHPDGGMIRVKPNGDPLNKFRSAPHVSKSIQYDAGNNTKWENEAFKIDPAGNPLPKDAGDTQEISSRLRELPEREFNDTKDAISDLTHPYLRK